MLEISLRIGCSLVIASALAFSGWASTLRLDACGRLARWVTAFVASALAATIVFLALAFVRIVTVPSLLLASLALAAGALVVAGRGRIAVAFVEDVRAIAAVPKRVGRVASAALALTVVGYVLLAAASASSPPLGADSLHYHLLHVGYWAQDGGIQRHPGVDAWGYYEFFPIGGEILWAWVAIPTRSSVLVGPAGVLISAMTALGTVSAARSLGATLERSALVAAVLVTLPAVTMFVTNAYVDNTALAFVVAGTALFLSASAAEKPRVRGILLVASSCALGLAVGVKSTMLPVLALGLGSNAVLMIARRTPPLRTAAVLAGSLAMTILIVGPRLLAIAEIEGSPLYPFPVRFLGHDISQGNPELRRLVLDVTKPSPPLSALVRELFFAQLDWAPMNFGVSGLVLFSAGALGVALWIRHRPRDARALVLIALALPALAFFMGENTLSYRTSWWWCIGRFIAPAAFSAALFASTLPNRGPWRIVDLLLASATLVGMSIPLTHGMCGYRWVGAASLTVVAVGVVAVTAVARKQSPRAGLGLLLVGIGALAATTGALRSELEPLILRGAARGECFEAHSIARPAGAFTIWERLADETPKRIAVAAGFGGTGHGVFRYPLLGRNWQHTLLYVSPAADGGLHDFHEYEPGPDRHPPALSFEHWVERLRESRVDYVVLIHPYNIIEEDWLGAHPELFRLEERGEYDAGRLYRFSPPAP
jgi:hypothetical protein